MLHFESNTNFFRIYNRLIFNPTFKSPLYNQAKKRNNTQTIKTLKNLFQLAKITQRKIRATKRSYCIKTSNFVDNPLLSMYFIQISWNFVFSQKSDTLDITLLKK